MVTQGASVFKGPGMCTVCHGIDGKGGIGPNLTDGTWLHSKGSYDEIVQQITTGVTAKQSKNGVPDAAEGRQRHQRDAGEGGGGVCVDAEPSRDEVAPSAPAVARQARGRRQAPGPGCRGPKARRWPPAARDTPAAAIWRRNWMRYQSPSDIPAAALNASDTGAELVQNSANRSGPRSSTIIASSASDAARGTPSVAPRLTYPSFL